MDKDQTHSLSLKRSRFEKKYETPTKHQQNIAMKNYYVVKKGYKPGVYTSLNSAEYQILGYPNAEWKGFNSHDDAMAYWKGTDKPKPKPQSNINPPMVVGGVQLVPDKPVEHLGYIGGIHVVENKLRAIDRLFSPGLVQLANTLKRGVQTDRHSVQTRDQKNAQTKSQNKSAQLKKRVDEAQRVMEDYGKLLRKAQLEVEKYTRCYYEAVGKFDELNEEIFEEDWGPVNELGEPGSYIVVGNEIYDDMQVASKAAEASGTDMYITPGPEEALMAVSNNGYGSSYVSKFRQDSHYLNSSKQTIYQVFTDGACSNNGYRNAAAGVGVFFGDNNPLNFSGKLEGNLHTSQRAELAAIKKAYEIIMSLDVEVRPYDILTDSQYAIDCLTVWYKKWETNGWLNASGYPVANQDLIKQILNLKNTNYLCMLKKVQAHSVSVGNAQADRLAREGIYI